MTIASRHKPSQEPAKGSAKQQSTGALPLRRRPAWAQLEKHYQKIKGVELRQLFADDGERGTRLAAEAAGVYLDYSKNRITDETLR
jgi:glucose-6-phosphate isomerase